MIQRKQSSRPEALLIGLAVLACGYSAGATAADHEMAMHGMGTHEMGTQQMMSEGMHQREAQDEALAHKMLGHINLAQIALDLNMHAEAGKQIERARVLEETLAARMPEMMFDSSFDYGKVTYKDKAVLADQYIPVIDDVFLVSDYETIFRRAKELDIDELSAGIMHLGVSLDLREVRDGLHQAAVAVDSHDYGVAKVALSDVFKGAIVEEEEVNDPKLLLAENLALAKAFVDDQQYDSARLTLNHVNEQVKNARKQDFSAIDKASLDRFSSEIDQMSADLRKKDPTTLERVSDDLSRWGDRITGWFS